MLWCVTVIAYSHRLPTNLLQGMGSWKLLLHSHCTCRGLPICTNLFQGMGSRKLLLQSSYMQVPTNLFQGISSWKSLLIVTGCHQFVSIRNGFLEIITSQSSICTNLFQGISSWKSLLIVTGCHQFVPIRNGFLEIITSQSLYMQVPTNLYQIISKASVLGNHCLITGMYSIVHAGAYQFAPRHGSWKSSVTRCVPRNAI